MGFNRARDPWQPSPVFRYAFGLAGKPSRPGLCFISTGTGDKQASIDAFYAGTKTGEYKLYLVANWKSDQKQITSYSKTSLNSPCEQPKPVIPMTIPPSSAPTTPVTGVTSQQQLHELPATGGGK